MHFGRKKTLFEQASEFAEDVLATTAEALHEAREKAGPALAEARDKAAPRIAEARDTAVVRAAEAREKAAPVVADARDRAAVRAAEARAKAAPLLADARERAAEQAAAAREAGAVKAARLRGEEPEKKGGLLKKLFLVGGLAAIGGVVYSKMKGQQESSWQSSYVPTPPPSSTGTAATTGSAGAAGAGVAGSAATGPQVVADDQAGAGPDESLADQAEAPHAATTPDDPAEVVDVEDVPQPERKPDPLTDPLPPQDGQG